MIPTVDAIVDALALSIPTLRSLVESEFVTFRAKYPPFAVRDDSSKT